MRLEAVGSGLVSQWIEESQWRRGKEIMNKQAGEKEWKTGGKKHACEQR